MKITLLVFFCFLIIRSSYSQNAYKDDIQSDVAKYAGIYKSRLENEISGGYYEIKFICIFQDGKFMVSKIKDNLSEGMVIGALQTNNLASKESPSIDGKFVTLNGKKGYLLFDDFLPKVKDFKDAKENDEALRGELVKTGKLEDKASKETQEFEKFWRIFRQAVASTDKDNLSQMIHFPFQDHNGSIYNEAKSLSAKNKDEFLKKYDRIFDDKTKKAVQMVSPEFIPSPKELKFSLEIPEKNYFLIFKKINGVYKLSHIPYME